MKHKILVADPISKEGLTALINNPNFQLDIQTNLSENELCEMIDSYEALIVRSQTQVTAKVLESASHLKVVARAGVGVDNIDINAATLNDIIVINAPDGNTISATEHSVAMLLAMARNIPNAHASLQQGAWNRKAFRGVELYQKTLGVIGTGRIGLGVIKRLQSFGMTVLAYDPFLTKEKAKELNIVIASLDEIAKKADFLTVHTPLTEKTKGMIGKDFFNKAKSTLQVINVARGGIIDEAALFEAIDKKQIAKAAIDVFEEEPPTNSPLISHDDIIVTPHLGVSTIEAQTKVAISVSEELVDYFEQGLIKHAINAPTLDFSNISNTAREFIKVSEIAAELAVQLFDHAPEDIKITVSGEIVEPHADLILRSSITQLLKPHFGHRANLINALVLLKEQEINYQVETRTSAGSAFKNYVEIRLQHQSYSLTIGATVIEGFGPRIIRINDFSVDFQPNAYQLITYHNDVPGIIGRTGALLGREQINIASMSLGRNTEGGQAMMIIAVDQPITDKVIQHLKQTQQFTKIHGTILSIPNTESKA
ncbi:phosphoglycerate dehydrogenase [Staphylococcus lugdunensis]|uniref:phosphoglycerate dehydrogenase n=1 Tax=Staphylococcus lugdunensis TaxID=28035 RepID=UPI001244C866|nr:phosphoglycerate dehydrogenase [Staphylococcus lugdunensis]QEX33761.1 phosphoglycerate dehydrogenase [Staphylococcus lugdunensis]